METTCGFFIVNKDNKILIVHPTGANENTWSIPKGRMDKGETELETAYREVEEETNIDLLQYEGRVIPLGKTKYRRRKKILCGFVFEYDGKIKTKLKCKTFVKNKFPEVDKYKWVSFKRAFELIHDTQQILLQKYLKLRK
jgi:8-oxo-dGTP pyrophosphatase MutT (NUDIX family)